MATTVKEPLRAKFRTVHEPQRDLNVASPSGEKIAMEHTERMDNNGRRVLVLDRKVPIYEKIQASREQCEIENIMRRAAEGDMSVLNAVNGQYLDITEVPRTLAEAQQFVINAKNEFDQLPKDVRAEFENNAEMYIAQYGTQKWADAVGITAKIETKKKLEENAKIEEETMKKAFENLAKGGSEINE